MSDSDKIRYTLAQYGQFLDDRRLDEFADLFTGDALWTVAGETVRSRSSIRSHIGRWPTLETQSKHLTTDSIIDVDGDGATAVSNYVVIFETPIGGVVVRAGRYVDTLRNDGDRWRFSTRINAGTPWRMGE